MLRSKGGRRNSGLLALRYSSGMKYSVLDIYVTGVAIAKLLFAAYKHMGNIEAKMRGMAIFIC